MVHDWRLWLRHVCSAVICRWGCDR